jgi:hypothetical protein
MFLRASTAALNADEYAELGRWADGLAKEACNDETRKTLQSLAADARARGLALVQRTRLWFSRNRKE